MVSLDSAGLVLTNSVRCVRLSIDHQSRSYEKVSRHPTLALPIAQNHREPAVEQFGFRACQLVFLTSLCVHLQHVLPIRFEWSRTCDSRTDQHQLLLLNPTASCRPWTTFNFIRIFIRTSDSCSGRPAQRCGICESKASQYICPFRARLHYWPCGNQLKASVWNSNYFLTHMKSRRI